MEAPAGAEQSLAQQIESYLSRRGGTVVQRLVGVMKKFYREDAPELESEDTLKAFVATQPDVFKVITSCNGVERVKLVNPPRRERRRRNSLLMDITIKQLEDMGCTSEEQAAALSDLYGKVQAEYAVQHAALADGAADAEAAEDEDEAPEEAPLELSSEDEFARSLGARRRRIVLRTGRVWLQAPEARERPPRENGGERRGERPPREDRPPREPRERRPREDRPPRPVGTPQEIELADDANDSTLIAKLVYERLKTRSADSVETGLPIKVVLRMVSLAFREARPAAEVPAMNSLRVFKHLLAALPGINRDRPVRSRRPEGRFESRRPPPPLEPVIWIEDEGALVAAIRAGVEADLAHAALTPEVMENDANAESGLPTVHKVLDQETWVTTVIGPTSSEEVLRKFLADNVDQQIWGFETEHRVGLGRRPAGNIAVIAISCLSNTFLWDVHNGGIPDCLHSWLADDRFFKGGVKVGPKAHKLRTQFAAAPKQFVELTVVAQSLEYIEEATKAGMRVISKNVLNLAVNRPPGIRDSNWEMRPLTKGQYHYAIEDAYVSALLFVHMSAKLHKMDRGDMLMKAAINLD